jgi:pantoate--beta-alanine ligase
MEIIRSVREMREFSAKARAKGKTIGLAPTMGCLHAGHLSLLRAAKNEADTVVASIFVNPVQFGPGEDFAQYPRTEQADLDACREAGADAVFLPTATEMFPAGFSTYVNEEQRALGLCGAVRPGHFRGVATVVLMLFNIVRPDVAVFGQKDAQQVAVLRKMAADLFVPVRIATAPIVREADGLALSSRNRYLSAADRALAPQLHDALLAGAAAARDGGPGTSARAIEGAVAAHLARHPQFRTQYIALVDADTMRPLANARPDAGRNATRPLLAAAVFLGATRLIDNILL